MSINEFIFSYKRKPQLLRHLTFWVIYCIYFYLQSIPPRQFKEFFIAKTYFIALMNVCAFMPVIIAITYLFVYYLLPNTIQKKRYILFVFGFLLIYVIGTSINYFTAEKFLIVTSFFPNTFEHRLEMSNYNTRWGMIIATIALGIKLGKNWYLQQQENYKIVEKRLSNETQLEKAKIHPELLLRSLDIIYNDIESGFQKAPFLILSLSELLSYSLYENETELVALQTELLQMQHLIAIEREKKEGAISIEMDVEGDRNNKFITPMILVKLLEQTITYLHSVRITTCFIELYLVVENSTLFTTLSFVDVDEDVLLKTNWLHFVESTRDKLRSYYTTTDFDIQLSGGNNEISISLILSLATTKEVQTVDSKINFGQNIYDSL